MSSGHLTRTRVRELLERHELGPSRALGQNFLCDPGTVDKIVRLAEVAEGDRVIEIGPGLGSLTVGLAMVGAAVTAIEIDRYLLPALEEVIAPFEAVTVLNADVRQVDWPSLLDDTAPTGSGRPEPDRPDGWKVVANLPYNIATPLLLDLLAAQPRLDRFLVMVQREAGERLAAPVGSKTYGIPSVLASYWATVRVVGSVRAELFLPRPKVESVLVELVRRPEPAVDVAYPALAELVRAGFGQRRKMVRRSLVDRVTPEQFAAAGVDPTARAEQLDIGAWGALARVTE
ncbi:MAG: 16S rRNA (adenine(1518)-N(6)/adenine(1519)-N(6))-dimethyltransferase RsmA [Actinomycetota bacterium]